MIKFQKTEYRKLAQGTSVFVFLFGVSDLIEVWSRAWWTPWWLFLLKAICVIGMAGGVFLAIRRKKAKKTLSETHSG
ncbi:hypothetical protein QQ054_30900 [Oscillatoria amoena NRMC-F 0135]|nr:hypothetical protein [Oscillatoria amoena NRMC-F 0135]